MKFRTEYEPGKAPFVLSPSVPVVLLGSCFADNIGAKMRSCLWEAENPLGTLYNPLSISASVRAVLESEESDSLFEESLFEAGGLWRSWLFDSRMAAERKEDVAMTFREARERFISLLKRGEVLFITFGTAWCYCLSDGRVVSNCHKQPGFMFTRRRLTISEITEEWKRMLELVRLVRPGLKVVFTVSPVRHLKDGFEGNMRSKAILLLAVEELCASEENCFYFPAYEIVNDDLRDYRFYAADLAHPAEGAVEYIWEIFRKMYVDEEGERRLKEGEAIRKGLEHRPLPLATRHHSPESLEREATRLEALEQRKKRFLAGRR